MIHDPTCELGLPLWADIQNDADNMKTIDLHNGRVNVGERGGRHEGHRLGEF